MLLRDNASGPRSHVGQIVIFAIHVWVVRTRTKQRRRAAEICMIRKLNVSPRDITSLAGGARPNNVARSNWTHCVVRVLNGTT